LEATMKPSQEVYKMIIMVESARGLINIKVDLGVEGARIP